MAIDDKAIFNKDVQAIAEKLENVSTDRIKKDNPKKLRSHLMKTKRQIEAKSDKKKPHQFLL